VLLPLLLLPEEEDDDEEEEDLLIEGLTPELPELFEPEKTFLKNEPASLPLLR